MFGFRKVITMLFILIILLLIIAKSTKVSPLGTFNNEYISIESTTNIKGIFVILVFISHFSQYVDLGGIYDQPYLDLQKHLNQMVVAPFLFYSGFGIMESITKKGFNYLKSVPTKRFLNLIINFDIAIVLFLITGFFLNKTYDIKTILLSLFGWKSVGNSNWYIFVTLILYILIFISFFVIKWLNCNGGRLIGCILLTALTAVFIYSQMLLGRPGYSYNSVMLLPLGCWYSLFRPQIEKIVMKNDYTYALCCIINLFAYFYFIHHRWDSIEHFTIWAFTFTFMFVLFTMKFDIKGNILSWFGSHVFSIYILQRIPMSVLQYFGFEKYKFYFFVISLILTILISMIFDNLTGKLSKLIFQRKKLSN